MKNFGCTFRHASTRDAELLELYFKYIDSCPHIRMPDIFRHIADMPASRFWVSSTRAAVVAADIARGDRLLYMRPNKREMFFEIYRRIIDLRQTHPDLSLSRLAEIVVDQPAPKFYMSPANARILILKARKQWFAARKSSHKHRL